MRSLLLSLALLAPVTARAGPDPWLGPDKALHFGASATLSATGYATGRALFDERADALLLGTGLALTAGVAKELADLGGLGQPSWRDLTWDVVGTASGLLVAWAVDELLQLWWPSPSSAG